MESAAIEPASAVNRLIRKIGAGDVAHVRACVLAIMILRRASLEDLRECVRAADELGMMARIFVPQLERGVENEFPNFGAAHQLEWLPFLTESEFMSSSTQVYHYADIIVEPAAILSAQAIIQCWNANGQRFTAGNFGGLSLAELQEKHGMPDYPAWESWSTA